MLIYLADLGHNQVTHSSDVYPLGVANLATYARASLPGGGGLEVRLFREPEDLKRAIDSRPPDVLGLSNYSWNHYLSRQLARYCKAHRGDALTVMGGPNWPLTHEVQQTFLRRMPEVDVYVDGPTYEGERAFVNLLSRYREVGGRRDELRSRPIPGVDWIAEDGGLVLGGPVERIRDLDEIPSPYTSGLLDEFLQTGYFPILQVARGCPFSCAFCNSGVASNNKVYAHSLDNVKADLLYLAERVRPETTLCFADDNFGMYERDEEIADYLGFLQDRYGWPQYVRTTTGKNNKERILRVMRKARGTLPMTAAVQSMNPEVLKNIKRSNIKLETYAAIQQELRAQGMQSYGELILCLPGETKRSFLKAVEDLLESGANRISAHQLMLLHGAELSNPESRRRFGFRTKFRLVARNLGNYVGEPVAEVEEMVVETPEFSFADYLECRVIHLLLTVFYYEGNFEEAFELARSYGVKPFDLMMALAGLLPRAPLEFRRMVEEFTEEGRQELFDSPEACLAWAMDNFDDLITGRLGGNLLSKYSMIGRFNQTAGACDFLRLALVEATAQVGRPVDPGELEAVMTYLRSVLLHVPFGEELQREVTWEAGYDVAAWQQGRYAQPLEDYRCSRPRTMRAAATPNQARLILSKVQTFGEHPAGLGKFTRTMFASDMRRPVSSSPEGGRTAERRATAANPA